MEKGFWLILISSSILLLMVFIGIVLCVKNRKRIVDNENNANILFKLAIIPVFLVLVYFGQTNINCWKDYKYVRNDTYIEVEAEVIRYTYVKRANWESTEDYVVEDPLFYIAETDEYIILDVKNVKVGKTYLIRFYPNSRICEIVEEII
ncbi:MAG: hypothetical protein IJY88_05965 [Clostridia bacterium]|nr:hypothetical protein [Clostridia bacterium]